ncbi:proline/glycine betaine ABC transporter permease [Methanofollis formosanus]|uniref:Proline/glycine betaine ABC transporter permease n=1 Tax=Methanofollis formosanus TaxID=299308 RepID=A0A8G0ZZV9_9EURY|nr:proline/glycine betaine ABC transporter permease [Methanofollis formosanus]QYZ78010.1 proline/glycine betaine ABC transporter permease [Methanofollis formosanus]
MNGFELPKIPLGDAVEALVEWIEINFAVVLDMISDGLDWIIEGIKDLLLLLPPPVFIALAAVLVWVVTRRDTKLAIGSALGLLLIWDLQLWSLAMETLALVLASTLFALIIGIPTGIFAARSETVHKLVKPCLDFMQTMPAFVYLIPAVVFFGLGNVPGMIATVVFAMPPVVRLTALGIQQVPKELTELADAFGTTERQKLIKVQLPVALPTIMAGINQCIMMALSMVVIAAMIGAQGLGYKVLEGIQRLDIGLGFEGGLAIVIIAIILDRVTQSLAPTRTER